MLGLETLDVLIGLTIVYLAFGLACTAIIEAVTAAFGVRGKNLEAALGEFLSGDLKQGQAFIGAFYAHPLVQSLSQGKDGLPSYVPPDIVSKVVEGLIMVRGGATSLPDLVESLPDSVERAPGKPEGNRIKGVLREMIKEAGDDAVAFRRSLEKSFNATMDRASGWFKRYTQKAALVISAVLVVGANADTIEMISSLASSLEARAKIVTVAAQRLSRAESRAKEINAAAEEGNGVADVAKDTRAAHDALDRAFEDMTAVGIRFGWNKLPESLSSWLSKVVGLLISVFAVSLGAPFWFDALQKFMKLRSSGVTHTEAANKKSAS